MMGKVMEVPGCRVRGADDLGSGLSLSVERRRRGGRCPACGRPSHAGHGRYRRRLAHLPSLGQSVHLELEVRRLRCAHATCPRRTFVKQVPAPVAPRAQRTRRLAEARRQIGFATSAAAGARLASVSGMVASASTVLRLMHATSVPQVGARRAIGVDD